MSNYVINRYPNSKDRSLRAWSAADEFIIRYLEENNLNGGEVGIYNDSFGYLTAHLESSTTYTMVNQKSQELAILQNCTLNKIDINSERIQNILDVKENRFETGVLKIPKSLDLFELYLCHIAQNLTKDGQLICGFMTRHFTKSLLSIAEKYFDSVEQSKAVKKSRLLILKGKKNTESCKLFHNIPYQSIQLKQFYGVFSSKNIDYATQFLIDHITVPIEANNILDLACGNGILAQVVQKINVDSNLHLIDDSYLAVESAKLNVVGENVSYYHSNNLNLFSENTFDYVISNPPFHLEYEIDLTLPLTLFEQVARCLSKNGLFQLVANKHLNYKPHLEKLFSQVDIHHENDKFIIYNCIK